VKRTAGFNNYLSCFLHNCLLIVLETHWYKLILDSREDYWHRSKVCNSYETYSHLYIMDFGSRWVAEKETLADPRIFPATAFPSMGLQYYDPKSPKPVASCKVTFSSSEKTYVIGLIRCVGGQKTVSEECEDMRWCVYGSPCLYYGLKSQYGTFILHYGQNMT
jgi:hypothetical protein